MSTYGLYTSGIGALGQAAKVDLIANNLANVATPGFRRVQISFRERMVEALEGRQDMKFYNAMVDRYGGAPFVDAVRFDTEAGSYEQTQRNLDFALQSKGFFSVEEMETGRRFYTRAGNFSLDSEGRLITSEGRYQVLSRDGLGIELEPGGSGDIRLGPEGLLYREGVEVAQVGIVDFSDYATLRKHGDNLFENLGGAPFQPDDIRVEQGVLEGSSVNPVVEMVDLIKAMRNLETNLQMIKIQDQALDRAVNDLGRLQR